MTRAPDANAGVPRTPGSGRRKVEQNGQDLVREAPDVSVMEADGGKAEGGAGKRGDVDVMVRVPEVGGGNPVIGSALEGGERDVGLPGELEEVGCDPNGTAEDVAGFGHRQGFHQRGSGKVEAAFFPGFTEAGVQQRGVFGVAATAGEGVMARPGVMGVVGPAEDEIGRIVPRNWGNFTNYGNSGFSAVRGHLLGSFHNPMNLLDLRIYGQTPSTKPRP